MSTSKLTRRLPTSAEALPGRAQRAYPLPAHHAVLGTPLDSTPGDGVVPAGFEVVFFGMGCFWGAERELWQTPGVWCTAVGYQGGTTPNPTYAEVCTGATGHAEVVRVVFDPHLISYPTLLARFWESHDPTQGYRQGNDSGTQYRSIVAVTTPAQRAAAEASREAYQQRLTAARYGTITTEIVPAGPFYYAEADHQQYLHQVPGGYCGLAGTGVACPVGLVPAVSGWPGTPARPGG